MFLPSKLTWNWFKNKGDKISWFLYLTVVLLLPLIIMNDKVIKWIIYIFLSIYLVKIYDNKYFATAWCFWGPLGAWLIQY